MKKSLLAIFFVFLFSSTYFNIPTFNNYSTCAIAKEVTTNEKQFWDMWQTADKYKNQHDKKNAIIYYKKAENLTPTLKNKLTKSTISTLYHNIALCYYPDDFLNAKNYALKAYNNGDHTLMVYLIIGDGCYAENKLDDAKKYYQSGLENLIVEKVQTVDYYQIQKLLQVETLLRQRLEMIYENR